MTLPRKDIRRFRTAIRILEREMARDLKSQTTLCGVTAAQCHLLMELDQRQPQTVNELATALGLDKTMTAKGRDTVKRINQLCDGIYQQLLERILEPKRRVVLDAIELLGGAMKSSRERRAGPAATCHPALPVR